MTSLPLIPAISIAPAARRASMPPQHLADLDLAGRQALVTGLGEPAFRAKQISTTTSGGWSATRRR